MKFVPSSLSGRLFLAAAILVALALIGTATLTDVILDRFVHRQIDQQLDTQIASLRTAVHVDPSGRLRIDRVTAGPPFDRPLGGWYWQVTQGKSVVARSPSLQGHSLEIPVAADKPPPPLRPPGAINPVLDPPPAASDGPGPNGEALHFRSKVFRIDAQSFTIAASAPNEAFVRPLRETMSAVLLALIITAIALMAAMYFQVRLGLRPLRTLRSSVGDIRAGRIDRLPSDQPSEIAPLVNELNKLLAENADGLARARRHVANLAHGLKTPLANLGLALEAPEQDPGGELQNLVGLMDRRIRHHLARARVAALNGASRAQTRLAPRVADIVEALSKIYADRRIAADVRIDPGLSVACEVQDVDEMLGNLIDNAFKWTKSSVHICAMAEKGQVRLTIDDDGPGLAENAIPDVLRPGKRLDESAPGYGFGLPISRELAELYGGTLELSANEFGGLCVTLVFPAGR